MKLDLDSLKSLFDKVSMFIKDWWHSPKVQAIKTRIKKSLGPALSKAQKDGLIYYDKIDAYIEKWGKKQRLTILIVLIFTMLFLWYFLLLSPLRSSYQTYNNQVMSVKRSVHSLKREANKILDQAKYDPNKTLQEEIKTLESQIKLEAQKIESYAEKQLSPPRMTQLLKNKVVANEDLKLLRLSTIAAMRVTPSLQGSASAPEVNKLPKIYNHSIEIDFSGNYFSTLDFLNSLKDSWRLYWNSIEYVVTDYPLAKVSLKVHILSKREHWDEL